jgi:hypothetical protein
MAGKTTVNTAPVSPAAAIPAKAGVAPRIAANKKPGLSAGLSIHDCT